MRSSVILALVLAGLTITASAQKHQKPKARPSHSEEKQTKSRAVKEPATRTSAATELRRVEQSSARASSTRKAEGAKATHTPVLKAKTKDSNPPIHFASSGGSGKGSKSKGGDPLKGRLRHKGSH